MHFVCQLKKCWTCIFVELHMKSIRFQKIEISFNRLHRFISLKIQQNKSIPPKYKPWDYIEKCFYYRMLRFLEPKL